MNNTKKGQMKIQQMIFVLLAVTVFFVMAGMFILVIQFSGVKERAQILEQENAMLLVSKIANSPEFSCGDSYGTSSSNCVDLEKVLILKENIAKYRDFWQVKGIEIRKIVPTGTDDEVMEVLETEGGVGVSNFVALCKKEPSQGGSYDKCELARIIVTY